MKVYHYTAGVKLRGIAQYGLTIGDVPTDIKSNKGRVGVWFTTSPTPFGMGLETSLVDKMRFRIEADIGTDNPSLKKWTDWAPSNVTPATIKALRAVASAEDTWFVFFGVIPVDQFVAVVDMATGEDVQNWGQIWPEGDSAPGISPARRAQWHKKLLKNIARQLR